MGRIWTSTVTDMLLGALSKRGHRSRSAACEREGTQLLAARVAKRRGRHSLAPFSFLSIDVGDVVCLLSMTERNPTPFPFKFVVLNTSLTKLSCPRCSPSLCEPSALPSSLHNPLKRRSFFSFSKSGQNRRRELSPWPSRSRGFHVNLAGVPISPCHSDAHALATFPWARTGSPGYRRRAGAPAPTARPPPPSFSTAPPAVVT